MHIARQALPTRNRAWSYPCTTDREPRIRQHDIRTQVTDLNHRLINVYAQDRHLKCSRVEHAASRTELVSHFFAQLHLQRLDPPRVTVEK
jgi:hypothetical protein